MPILFSFLAYTAFSFMDAINKVIFTSEHISFFSFMLFLNFCIFLIFLIWGSIYHKSFKLLFITGQPFYLFVRCILAVSNTVFSLLAISHLSLVTFYTIIFVQPIIATVIAITIKLEIANWSKIGLIVLSFFGVLIHIEVWSETLPTSIVGIFAALGIAITGALSGIITKKHLSNENTLTIGTYIALCSIIVPLIYFALSIETIPIISDTHTILLIMSAGSLATLGIFFFMKSYQIASKVQTISQLQYIQLAWGFVLGIILFANVPSFWGIFGTIIIIITNLANSYNSIKRKYRQIK